MYLVVCAVVTMKPDEMIQAAVKDDAKTVQAFLKGGADPDYRGQGGGTGIVASCQDV